MEIVESEDLYYFIVCRVYSVNGGDGVLKKKWFYYFIYLWFRKEE